LHLKQDKYIFWHWRERERERKRECWVQKVQATRQA